MRSKYARSIDLFFIACIVMFIVGSGFVHAPADKPSTNEARSADDNLERVRQTNDQAVSVVAVGDVMLGRYVRTLMEAQGESYPFTKLGELFRGQDHTLVNLEGPITEVNLYPHENPRSTMKFRFAPSIAQLLHEEGVTVANLANNHSLDQGGEGMQDTRMLLHAAGILHSGTATNDPSFFGVATTTKGIPLLFVGFNATWPHDERAVLAYLTRQPDETFVIVSVHWGAEYELTQSEAQRALAHAFIDAGADIVIGHHPHVVQGIERYRDTLIFYSLGNFIFDQYFSTNVEEGLALGITIERDTTRVRLIPLESSRSQPAAMASPRKEAFLQALVLRSDPVLEKGIMVGEVSH
jgi:poly-gamma-glutamate synthesis protein (capsule biosynthesis protein)